MEKVHQIEIRKNMQVKELVEQMLSTGAFNAGRMGQAYQIAKNMIKDTGTTKFLAISGALISAGLQKVFVQMVNSSMVDIIVTTGAILTHDLLEDLGEHHVKLQQSNSDSELREKGINRIYDVAAADSSFAKMEGFVLDVLEQDFRNHCQKPVPTHVFLNGLGKRMSEKSLLGAAIRKEIPVFCPAIMDSMLGVHVLSFSETTGFTLDPIAELKKIISLSFSAKKTGAIVLGGGVPKNYTFQACLVSGKMLDYAIQFTMDRPEHGGLSGASLEEAVSWGKISSKGNTVTVIADVTIALPLLVASLLE